MAGDGVGPIDPIVPIAHGVAIGIGGVYAAAEGIIGDAGDHGRAAEILGIGDGPAEAVIPYFRDVS